MEIIESVKKLIQEMIVPELNVIKAENGEIKATLVLTNKRLDNINVHLADQSRRIDETNKRIDKVHTDLIKRIDETNKRIDEVRSELTQRMDNLHADLIKRYDSLNGRFDRFYESTVRKDEHGSLERRLATVEREMARLKKKSAA
jgi:uncharacterized coiled-coil DUF342 family protein